MIKDFSGMDKAALKAKVKDLRKELFTLRMQKVTVLEKPHMQRELKRDVARILTKLRGME
jgi:ribosomal protein L29